VSAGSSYRRSSVVSFRLDLSNPTLPEITDGYEIQLHHALGHDPGFLIPGHEVSCHCHVRDAEALGYF
ncbi:hypothetical protein, partial [Rhizobium sp. P007]|uniref:hypothetical protein n=1 Tax=Rhizobium sp. P007 TaxID=285908 RepID=UPI001AEE9742